jgi:hypothetical protein
MSVGRSGSSAVAGMLHHMGVYMGEAFEASDKNNVYGTFEDLAFVNLNRAVITGQASEDEYEAMDRKLPLWGIKDPQLCLTAHLLIPHLENVHIIVVRRNPDKVIDSYNRAYLSGIEYANNWFENTNRYLEQQLEHFDGPVLNVWWEDVTQKPNEVARKMAEFLGISDEEKITSGAKHIQKVDKPKGWGNIAIGVRMRQHPEPDFFTSWTAMLTGGVRSGDTVLLPQARIPAHGASNAIVNDFLMTDKDSLFFVDDDMAFDGMALEKLRNNPDTYDYDIVFGFCTHRTWPPKPVIMKLREPQPNEPKSLDGDLFDLVHDFDDGDIIPVDAVGLAFTIIKRHVFEAMLHPKYGFQHTYWFDYGIGKESDDISFCRHARELGFTMAVDTNVKISHIGYRQLGWNDFREWQTSVNVDMSDLKPVLEYAANSDNGVNEKASNILKAIEVSGNV